MGSFDKEIYWDLKTNTCDNKLKKYQGEEHRSWSQEKKPYHP